MKIIILSAFEDSMQKKTGGSVRIFNLSKALAAAGNKVSVILPKFQPTSTSVDGISVYALKGSVPKAALKALGNRLKIARTTSFYSLTPSS